MFIIAFKTCKSYHTLRIVKQITAKKYCRSIVEFRTISKFKTSQNALYAFIKYTLCQPSTTNPSAYCIPDSLAVNVSY